MLRNIKKMLKVTHYNQMIFMPGVQRRLNVGHYSNRPKKKIQMIFCRDAKNYLTQFNTFLTKILEKIQIGDYLLKIMKDQHLTPKASIFHHVHSHFTSFLKYQLMLLD